MKRKILLNRLIQIYGRCNKVPVKSADMLSILSDIFHKTELPKLDIDAMGIDSLNQKTIIIQIGIKFNFNSYSGLTSSIDEIVQRMIPLWTEDTIPLNSLSDKAHYIRDLLFLKACYEKK